MRLKVLFAIGCWLLAAGVCMGQRSWTETVEARRSKIDFQHFMLGTELAWNENTVVGLMLGEGLGSRFSPWGADFTVHYRIVNPLAGVLPVVGNNSSVVLQNLQASLSGQLHVVRADSYSLFVGAETALTLNVGKAHAPSLQPGTGAAQDGASMVRDGNIGRNHLSVTGKMGIRSDHWECSLFCEYDMQPMINQKYLFESVDYDYESLRSSIRERFRFGLRLSYLLVL